VRKGGCRVLAADFFWRLFERTGSIVAYLLYRQSRAMVN